MRSPQQNRFNQPSMIRQGLKKANLIKTTALLAAAAFVFWLVVFEWAVKDSFVRLGIYAVSVIVLFLFSNWLDTLLDIKGLSQKVAKLDAEESERKLKEQKNLKEVQKSDE